MECWVFSFLQNTLNVLDIKFIQASETIFLGSQNSVNVTLAACTRSCTDSLATFLQLWTYCNNLQYKDGFCY